MKLLRAIAVAAAIFVLAPPPPASAQISPSAVWSCEFTNSPTDCGLYIEAVASQRAPIVRPGGGGPPAGAPATPPGGNKNPCSRSDKPPRPVVPRSPPNLHPGADERGGAP